MDQLNPYQAPERLLPTAIEVAPNDHHGSESTEDLVYGLKLLKISALLYILSSLINGCWHFFYAYRDFIEQPAMQDKLGDASYWITSGLVALAEALFITGLYWCSTRVIAGVSRMPLLLALILGAMFFPSVLYQYALQKPWIYFDGLGNGHAVFFLEYRMHFSGVAFCIWLALWMTLRADGLSHKRVMTMLFFYTLSVVVVIFRHVIYLEMLVARPDDPVGLGMYDLFGGLLCVSGIFGDIVARRLYASLIASLQEHSATLEKPVSMPSL